VFNHPIYLAVKRSLLIVVLLTVLGNIFTMTASYMAQYLGPIAPPLMNGFGFVCIGAGIAKLMYAVLDPHADSEKMYRAIMSEGNIAAGLGLIARAIVIAVVIIMTCTASRAAEPPAQAMQYLPILKAQEKTYWPDMPYRSYLGAQIEQETGPCPSRRSCWNPLAELKTSREHGVGLPQLTVAYTALGTVRFDALTELANRHPKDLAGLSWAHWQDPTLQLRAIVLKNRDTCKSITGAKTPMDLVAFCASAYNGGAGGLSNDRLSCRGTTGCDAGIWFGNVEKTSFKSKTVIPGYGGQSPVSINRTYVHNVIMLFMPKYKQLDT
jgi:hypothetical protein